MKTVYLDYAAATPVDPDVVKAMAPYTRDRFFNPSATYLSAQNVAKDIESSRRTVAAVLGCKPTEIYFTAGGTEANNLAILGVAKNRGAAHIVSTAIEHESILSPLVSLTKQGWSSTLVKPEKTGIVDVDKLLSAITDKTVIVSVMYANNEIGTVQPIKDIAQKIKQIRLKRQKAGNKRPLYLHTDACQATNYLDTHVHRLGVDLMTINSGKIYGPKQCGALFIRSGVVVEPIIFGGGQEFGMRSGTENVPGIIGFGEAMKITEQKRQKEVQRLSGLQTYFIKGLQKNIPNCQINGSLKHRLPNNIHVTLANQDNERVMMLLDEHGIMCAVGSACSASSDDPSHVLMAIGLSKTEAQSSLRFTLGRQTTKADIDYTLKTLVNCLQ